MAKIIEIYYPPIVLIPKVTLRHGTQFLREKFSRTRCVYVFVEDESAA